MLGTVSELRLGDFGFETGVVELSATGGAVSVRETGAGGTTGAFSFFATAESGATTGGCFGGVTGMVIGVASAGSLVSLTGAREVATWWRSSLAVGDELPVVLWLGVGLEV